MLTYVSFIPINGKFATEMGETLGKFDPKSSRIRP